MTTPGQFTIGAGANCTDGSCGEVSRVVVDPIARAVTHLVVEPQHRHGLGRLVPLDLVDIVAGDIRLRCTLAEFNKFDLGVEAQFLTGAGGWAGYAPGQVLAWPYYHLGPATISAGSASQVTAYDAVPLGEMAVRRGEHVRATDGLIGRVQGLVIDPDRHQVTHVLLQEGHLWGHKEVAIPIGAIAELAGGIRLRIDKQDVQDLPPVDVGHADW
jgi:sporulation protein YlmC with PRC-barrel domain